MQIYYNKFLIIFKKNKFNKIFSKKKLSCENCINIKIRVKLIERLNNKK